MAAIRQYSKQERAEELARFFSTDVQDCLVILDRGFGELHHAVSEDFRKAHPSGEAELLDWYRSTDAYIWELTAYHLDPAFNYEGFCRGVIDGLIQRNAARVLVLGDGIGDLSVWICQNRMYPTYHDLAGSRTARFAKCVADMRGAAVYQKLTPGWEPRLEKDYDAVLACDFLEHCPNVEEWVLAISEALVPGGILFSQNAFACGSGENGSIPMHLSCNDRFEKDWDPLLASLGYTQESSNWYRRPE